MFAWKRASVLAIAGAAVLAGLPLVHGETCLSPFVKRLDRPEKLLYVYCVDADGKDNDFLAVIDVANGSKTYGQITYQLDLGSKGNEPHHFGFTDDRTHIWGLTLFSNRIFLIDVATDPARPRIVKTLEGGDVVKQTGLSSPHTAYALPGRMLISFLSGKDGTLPAGFAEFTNEGAFIRAYPFTRESPYGYDIAIRPDINRMVTSGFTYYDNYKNPLAKMDFKKFGSELMIWDFRERKPLATLKTGAAPLECRWSLKPGNNYGFTNCALDDSIWCWIGAADGSYSARRLCKTGKLPVDLRQSPDDRYLFVSCFMSDEVQQWDVSDLANPKLVHTLKPGEQPNMMHVTGDGKRMYITNSLLSTMDRTDQCWVKLAHITPEGLKLDPDFFVDLSKLKTGPARGHDMLIN
jgi:selenium-binding protein 1